MADRTRLNTFICICFAEIAIQVNRRGRGWKKGTKKGELPIYNPRLVNFALTPHFDAFVAKSDTELPEALKKG